MPSPTVKKEMNEGIYFLTLTVQRWYYLFDRHNRWEIIVASLRYCQEHKNLQVFAFVFMLNHIHLIVKSPDVSGFLRDFKKYTSLKIMENLRATEPSVATLFAQPERRYSIWQKTNMPIIIESLPVFVQKKEYIEYNPVRKGYVEKPEHWRYSSANHRNTLSLSSVYNFQC